MKLKYYLRGLGTGIIVTALIMCVSDKDVKMTEAEIRQEAVKLGMVDGTQVLADASEQKETKENTDSSEEENVTLPEQENPEKAVDNADDTMKEQAEEVSEQSEEKAPEKMTEEPEEKATEQPKEETTEEATEEATEQPEEEATEEATEQPEEEATEEATEQPEENVATGEEIIIVIQSGDGSRTLARKLKEAGVIEDVEQFDYFLCANGYDKRICTGNHVVKKGMSDEELAKIFTTRVR